MSISCESWFAGADKASFTVAADGFSVAATVTDSTLIDIYRICQYEALTVRYC